MQKYNEMGLDNKDVLAQDMSGIANIDGRSAALLKAAGMLPDYTRLPGETAGTLKHRSINQEYSDLKLNVIQSILWSSIHIKR